MNCSSFKNESFRISLYVNMWRGFCVSFHDTLASLQKMEERLPTHFMRVHRSYIVNLRKITEVSRLHIIFDKNTYIPVGDNYKERFMKYISKLSLS